MFVRTLFFLTVSLLLTCVSPVHTPATPTDKELLQGTWKMTAVEVEGKKLPMDGLAEARLVVTGNDYVFTLGKVKLELVFTLAPCETPKHIDLAVAKGPDKGKTLHGIYVLDGDTYKICRHTQPGKGRPYKFDSSADNGWMIVEWRRVK